MENSFEVQNERMETLLNELSRRVKSNLPPGYGFTLFLFNFGKDGAMYYASSAQRADMILALEEFINKQKNDATGHTPKGAPKAGAGG